jgi:hypothetical protein
MKAFPLIDFETEEDGYIYFDSGMDLRDYFAAKAMQAMLSWENVGDFDVSKEAYMMADAMMKAREGK